MSHTLALEGGGGFFARTSHDEVMAILNASGSGLLPRRRIISREDELIFREKNHRGNGSGMLIIIPSLKAKKVLIDGCIYFQKMADNCHFESLTIVNCGALSSLGRGLVVNGDLRITTCPALHIVDDITVGGNLFIKGATALEIGEKIEVGGKFTVCK